jgi:hypothetical protein
MGVTEYARFDPTGDHFMPALVMETLDGANYREQPLETDDDGNLRGHSGVLGLDICVTPDLELRLYDPAADEWLLTHQETEEARRESEEARRESEEARRESEEARRESEEARRESEEARRAAEAEIERLRSELRRLQQP